MEYNTSILTPFKRLLGLLKPDKKDIFYIYLFAVLNGIVNLSLPLGVQAIISFILTGAVSTSWMILVAIVLIGIAFTGVLQILQLSILESLQQRMFSRAALDLAYRIPRFKQEIISKYDPQELINRFFDVLTVQKGLPKVLLDFSTSILNIIFGLILLSFYHPFFVFFGLLALFILLVIFYFSAPRGLATSIKESSQKYKTVYWLEELARSMTTFKLAGLTDLPLKKSDQLSQDYLKARKAHFKVLIWQYAQSVTFKTVITGGLLILGGLLVMQREINIGQFVAGEIIIILIINAVEKIILSLQTIYDLLTGLEKLGYVTDIPLEQRTETGSFELNPCHCMEIELKNLYLQLPPNKTKVLKDISLHIKSGEKVCISGRSGSGKTALLHLLGSLYQNYEGVLAFDGMPLGSLDIESLRYSMGDNFNQESLFTATLAENISLGRKGVSLQQIQSAVEISGLSEFVMNLHEGLQTIMDPANRNLPQSIIKRIFLARSIVHEPSLLLLDDLSDLSELNDYFKIIDYITSTERKWTLIVSSNDAEIASRCQRVVLLNDGQVYKTAPFADLAGDAQAFRVYFNR